MSRKEDETIETVIFYSTVLLCIQLCREIESNPETRTISFYGPLMTVVFVALTIFAK